MKAIVALVTALAVGLPAMAGGGADGPALILGVGALLSQAGDASGASAAARDAISYTPQGYLEASINNAKRRMTGKWTGDGWTWHARFTMDGFLDSYLATRDAAWLDAAAKYFDWCVSLLEMGPDGHQGWLGPVAGQEGKLSEHPIGDAIMMDPMVRFAALVLKDEPALAETYGDKARSYATLARKLMFEKWEARGTWHEDGPYGVFTEWPWYFTEQEAGAWHEPPPGTRAITLPMNMQVHWGLVAARLHRITGEKAWREKSLKLFRFVKSRLVLYDDHYSWNYWEPFGPWDVTPDNPQAFRHWIGTHAYRDYQLGEVNAFVEAFHLGVVFDAQDMKRFVRTNLHVMWNGRLDDIQWNNSNAGVQKGAFGQIRLASKPTGIFNRYAGTLWTDLVDFDATARKIYEKQLEPKTYQYAYYYNVTRKREPSYERRHADLPADVFEFPFVANCTLGMAAAMPSVVERGKPTLLACQARVEGGLRIELRSEDGTRAVATLRGETLQKAGLFNLSWDAKDAKAGRYRVRWTLKGEYRDFPIEIR